MIDDQDPKNPLARCHMALHQVLAEQFDHTIETGQRVRVLKWPIGAVDFPAIAMVPGSPWLELIDERLTLCGTHIASFDLVVMAGNPLQTDSWETLQQWVSEVETVVTERVHESPLWNPRDGVFQVDSIGQPSNDEFNNKTVLASTISVSAPIHM